MIYPPAGCVKGKAQSSIMSSLLWLVSMFFAGLSPGQTPLLKILRKVRPLALKGRCPASAIPESLRGYPDKWNTRGSGLFTNSRHSPFYSYRRTTVPARHGVTGHPAPGLQQQPFRQRVFSRPRLPVDRQCSVGPPVQKRPGIPGSRTFSHDRDRAAAPAGPAST